MSAGGLDLFAGPGGWDEGIRELGLEPLGIEWDDAACRTRVAAGHRTLQADVAELDPADYEADYLIASPPCPTFSAAGGRSGHEIIDVIFDGARDLARGSDTRAQARERAYELLWPIARLAENERATRRGDVFDAAAAEKRAHRDARMSLLVLEPLRWALQLKPRWLAFEQVPPVLDLWRMYAHLLEEHGWRCWAGILSAEQYGVPQTRERAILLGHRDRFPHPPRATHQAYVPGVPAAEQHTLEGVLLPWVSMAEALGWGMTGRPTPTVTAGGTGSGGGIEVFGSDWSRAKMEAEREAGRWEPTDTGITVQHRRSGDRLEEEWSADRPADTVTSRTDRWQVVTERGAGMTERHGERRTRGLDEPAPTVTAGGSRWSGGPRWRIEERQEHGTSRDEDEPAPTITASMDNGNLRWLVNTGRDWKEGGTREDAQTFDATEQPAPTVDGKGRWHARIEDREREQQPRDPDWPNARPATTVAGDPRIAQPGHKADERNPESPGRMEGAIRVSLQEAAVLQGFRRDYPFQGTKAKQFEQVGNAVPPPLARAVVAEMIV